MNERNLYWQRQWRVTSSTDRESSTAFYFVYWHEAVHNKENNMNSYLTSQVELPANNWKASQQFIAKRNVVISIKSDFSLKKWDQSFELPCCQSTPPFALFIKLQSFVSIWPLRCVNTFDRWVLTSGVKVWMYCNLKLVSRYLACVQPVCKQARDILRCRKKSAIDQCHFIALKSSAKPGQGLFTWISSSIFVFQYSH